MEARVCCSQCIRCRREAWLRCLPAGPDVWHSMALVLLLGSSALI